MKNKLASRMEFCYQSVFIIRMTFKSSHDKEGRRYEQGRSG
jgi:hypothetical protein